ncbi:pPIWI_RE module domain-containing protein [Nocardia sp. NPDC101769]|uniref:pPIWI_RE module domain-containing protein n=1 Tax=Nocardia sp. NPDC101769 TaxID=3364333 RepID=UPI003827878A
MGFTYRSISRAAYLPADSVEPWVERYRALPFPEQARQSLLRLCNHERAPGRDPFLTVPTGRLDVVLQCLAPDLVVCPRNPDAPDHWLYVPAELADPLPGGTFSRLLSAWLHDIGPAHAVGTASYRALLQDTLAELETTPLDWEELEVDLLDCPLTLGGTAAPTTRQYQLTTDALARRIAALEPYRFDTGTLHFRAVPRGPRQQGAELMSQPLMRPVKGKPWWFSVTITVSLHTVPFAPRPRLHIHTGVRRWATRPRASTGTIALPYGRATSVYLRPPIPWLPGAPASDRFAVSKLGYDRATRAIGWVGNGPAGLLRRLDLRQNFPDPTALLSAPEDWLGEGPGLRAAVVHSTHMGEHGIGTGLMSHQRSQLMDWIDQALPPSLTRTAPLTRSTVGTNKPANARPSTAAAASTPSTPSTVGHPTHARRVALAAATRALSQYLISPTDELKAGTDVLVLRLLWQSASVRDAAIAELADILGLGAPNVAPEEAAYDTATAGDPAVVEWRTPELVVRLRCLPLAGGLAAGLSLSAGTRSAAALGEAIAQRRRATTQYLARDDAKRIRPSLALVEIDHRLCFRPSNTDPKFALRLGCADAGMLTQFVAVPSTAPGIRNTSNVRHRVRSAWLDGLRQLGVRVLPEHTLGDELPPGLRYAALWMIKRRVDGPTRLPLHLPIAVLLTPIPDTPGHARVEGWDDTTCSWVPYPQFLLGLVERAALTDEATRDTEQPPRRVSARAWRRSMHEQRRQTEEFVQRLTFALYGAPTVLITHSQNSRQHWSWLQDGRLVRDLLRTGTAPASGLQHNLRIVRIRGGAGRETAQWWGIGDPRGINGLPSGLWVPPADTRATDQRVFYSTTEKASQFKASAVSADRLSLRKLTRGKNIDQLTTDADKPAWNPSLVEITVAGCHHHDNPEAFALAMHQLRQAPDYLDALSLPLPLHLAELAQEYVLPTESDDTDTTDPDLAGSEGPSEGPSSDEEELNGQAVEFEEVESELSAAPMSS